MQDTIDKYYFLDEESNKMLSTVTKKLENLQLQNKKQNSIQNNSVIDFWFLFWSSSIWLDIFEIKTFFISFNVSFLYSMKSVNFKDPFLIYFRWIFVWNHYKVNISIKQTLFSGPNDIRFTEISLHTVGYLTLCKTSYIHGCLVFRKEVL